MPITVVCLEVAGHRYGVDVARVVMVVPWVPLRRVPGVVPGIVGVLRYRGALVPVVDLLAAWTGQPAAPRMSTRIAVCDLEGGGGSWADFAAESRRCVGLLAEGMTRVAHVDPDAPEAGHGPETPGARGLGAFVRDGDEILQLVEPQDLVPAEILASLVREAEESGAEVAP